MKTHQLIHSGQCPYACDACNKTFNYRSNMKLHQLLHSGQRPYLYDVCKKHSVRVPIWRNI